MIKLTAFLIYHVAYVHHHPQQHLIPATEFVVRIQYQRTIAGVSHQWLTTKLKLTLILRTKYFSD